MSRRRFVFAKRYLAGFCSDEVDNQGLLFGFCVKLDISADFGIVDSSYFMNICSLEHR